MVTNLFVGVDKIQQNKKKAKIQNSTNYINSENYIYPQYCGGDVSLWRVYKINHSELKSIFLIWKKIFRFFLIHSSCTQQAIWRKKSQQFLEMVMRPISFFSYFSYIIQLCINILLLQICIFHLIKIYSMEQEKLIKLLYSYLVLFCFIYRTFHYTDTYYAYTDNNHGVDHFQWVLIETEENFYSIRNVDLNFRYLYFT